MRWHATGRVQMADETRSIGVLLTDAAGQVRFQAGSAGAAAVQAALLVRSPASGSPLYAIQAGDASYVVLRLATGDGQLFLVRPESERSPLVDFITGVDFAFEILNHLLSSPYEAMTVVDGDGILRFMSPVHERFFGLRPGEAVGKPVTEVIENTRLQETVRSGKAEIGHIQEMRGVSRVVSRIPILRDGKVIGAIGQVMFKGPEQVHQLSRQIEKLKAQVAYYEREIANLQNRPYGLDEIEGECEQIQRLKAMILKVAPLDVPVLLVGESGTGKELVAHAIHNLSMRRSRPMVSINSTVFPVSLVESELFGYEAGAFTGASRHGHKGKFELADGGTLFLDEIGDMPLDIQAKLLRVVQEGVFERVGGGRPLRSNFRLITASNRDLETMVSDGRFRLDVYYRISGVTLQLPALRDRVDDIPILTHNFLERYARRHKTSVRSVHASVFEYLREQPWPGNVRQLLHEVEQALIFCDSSQLTVGDFRGTHAASPGMPPASGEAKGSMKKALADAEATMIREALARHGGNKKRVAEALGISRSYLYKKLGEG